MRQCFIIIIIIIIILFFFWHEMETWKKSEPQMGFEPTTLHDLVGCSTH